MTDFLVRHFVKNSEKVNDIHVRTAYGQLAGIVGIICNLTLFTAKLVIGVLLRSISVMADAFNNLSDAASSIISFVGAKLAGKPADEDHPFGHGRIEYISACIVAFLVIQVGFTLFQQSIGKIREPEDMSFSLISLAILALSIGVKLWMSVFNRKLGKRIHSSVMKATAADALGDVCTTAATVFSLAVYGIWNVNLDGIVGLVVSVVVMIAGVNIARETLAPLIGEAISPDVYKKITSFVESYDGILGSHDLIVHNYGPSRSMASIHAEVSNEEPIEVSHEIIDRIEREAMREFGMTLVIHMDPVAVNDEHVLQYRRIVDKVVKQVDQSISIHDFRMVNGEDNINLIFDAVVSYRYDGKQLALLRRQIIDGVKAEDPRLSCVITIDRSYMGEESG